MNRKELQSVSIVRVQDARHLLSGKHYAGAYYLVGYAIECGLKACIAKKTREHDFPDKKITNESYSHDLPKLLRLAGLEVQFSNDCETNPALLVSWGIVKAWSEESRYATQCTKERAEEIYEAVSDDKSGLIAWLERYW